MAFRGNRGSSLIFKFFTPKNAFFSPVLGLYFYTTSHKIAFLLSLSKNKLFKNILITVTKQRTRTDKKEN
jgi:hypothetical protein